MTDKQKKTTYRTHRRGAKTRCLWFPSLMFGDGLAVSVLVLTIVMLRRMGLDTPDTALAIALLCLPVLLRPLFEMIVTHFWGTTKVWILSTQFISALALAAVAFTLHTSYWLLGTACFMPFFICSALFYNIALHRFYVDTPMKKLRCCDGEMVTLHSSNLNTSTPQHLNTYNIMYNTENKQKGRFAPSPTGRMHLGNVFSALLSWLSIKAQGGDWVLRIEDIDPQRSHMEYADLIMSDLEWLGLTWDEGPFYQSERGEIYEAELQKLTLRGMTYPCYCTRADILATQAPHESDGRVVYKGTCRNLKPGTHSGPAAIRMRVPDEGEGIITFVDGHYGEQTVDLTTQCGDFIVRRKDGAWAYQLAVVVDDALMGITEVVRGRDLLLSSPQQIYLANQLGFVPPRFTHLPLLCNTAGQRLSKRDRSLDMEALRSRFEAEEIIGMLAYKAGLQESPERVTAQQLVAGFDWSNIGCEDIEF